MTCRDERTQALFTAKTRNNRGQKGFIGEDVDSYESWSAFYQELKKNSLYGYEALYIWCPSRSKRAISETYVCSNGKNTWRTLNETF